MPRSLEKKRGGVIRYRTIKLGKDKYAHIAVVRKKGPRGGRTIMGRIHKKKSKR
ncbi:MAG: hypothetical protein QXE51_05945 [Nitrososphaeria archaeon]